MGVVIRSVAWVRSEVTAATTVSEQAMREEKALWEGSKYQN